MYYQLLCTYNSADFWRIHEANKPPDYYSEDFKDLITSMLQFNPNQRLTIADIIGHPWM